MQTESVVLLVLACAVPVCVVIVATVWAMCVVSGRCDERLGLQEWKLKERE